MEDTLVSFVKPYADLSGPQPEELERGAKLALLALLDYMRDHKKEAKRWKWHPELKHFEYLFGLVTVYLPLMRGLYCEACNEIRNYIWRSLGRKEVCYDGLVALLEEMEAAG